MKICGGVGGRSTGVASSVALRDGDGLTVLESVQMLSLDLATHWSQDQF